MKKRVLSVLLVIALLVTVGIVAAQADATPVALENVYEESLKMTFPTESPVVHEAFCPKCGETVTWNPISTTTNTGIVLGGHFYLFEDVQRDKTIFSYNSDICVHLNGKTVELINNTNDAVFLSQTDKTLTVMGDGNAIGTSQIALNTGAGTINVCGGTYTTAKANTVSLAGTLNLYDGEIGSCVSNLVFTKGSYNVYGGAVTNDKLIVPNGENAVVRIEGGSVAPEISMNNGTFFMTAGSAGKVTRTTGTKGINISGTAKIANLSLAAGSTKVTVGEMTNGAKVTVNVADNTAFTNEGVAAYAKYFASKDGYEITADANGALKSVAVNIDSTEELLAYLPNMSFEGSTGTISKFCPACNAVVSWTELTGETHFLLSGNAHYYLAGDIIREKTLTCTSTTGSVCFFLNGHTITTNASASDAYTFNNNWTCTFNVMDNGKGGAYNNGSNAFGNINGTVNVYGGTYSTSTTTVVHNIGTNGTFNLYGGTLGEATTQAVNLTKGSFNVYGGNIIKPVNVSAGTVNLAGSPTIATLNLTNGFKLNSVALTAGASVAVKADGAFTSGDAAASAPYFTALTEGHVILTDKTTGVLSSGVKAYETPKEIMEYANAMTFPASGNSEQLCPKCNEVVTWKPLDSSNLGNLLIQSKAHYYVAGDITRTGYMFAYGADACIHLNGKTITHAPTSTDGTFLAAKTMNIMGTGTVTSTVAALAPNSGGTLNIYGGDFVTTSNIIALNNSTFNMYAGSITGAQFWLRGTANATVENAEISYFKIEDACTGKLNVAGETVIDTLVIPAGKTLGTIALTSGSAIGVNADGVFTGELADVASVAAFFTATNDTKIVKVEGNTLTCVAKPAEPEPTEPSVPETEPTEPEPEPTEPEPSVPALPEINTTAELIAYANGMTFPTEGNSEQFCPECKEVVTWKPLTGTTGALFGGHYYVDAETVERTTVISAYYGKVCLHLNGNAINTTGRGVFETSMYGINVMGNGVVTTNKNIFETVKFDTNVYGGTYSTTAGSIVSLQNNANFNVYGGEFGNTTAITVWSAGSFNVYGGEIACPTLIVPNGADAIVNVEGGKITGAGISMNNGTINVTGGEINLITRTADTKAINISGTAKIANLNLAAGSTKVTVGEMTEGAEVTVTAALNTAFTNEGVAAYAKYFVSKDGYEITADANGALSCTVKTYTIDEVAAYAAEMKFTGTGNQTAYCPKCNENVTWTEITATSSHLIGSSSGAAHYYLSDNVTREKCLYAYYGSACIFFNGNTITYNAIGTPNDPALGGNTDKVVTLMGNGGITSVAENRSAAMTNGGVINVCGGTYTVADPEATVIGVNSDTGVLNIYAGTFNCDGIGAGKGTVNIEGAITGNVWGQTVNVNGAVDGVVGAWDDGSAIATTVDVTVDVRGKKNVTVTGSGNVTALDSYSKGAFQTDGYATFTGVTVTPAANYISLPAADGAISLHYYEMKVSGVSLKTGDQVGLYYKGKWTMDEALRENSDVGIVISLTDVPTADFYKSYEDAVANGGKHKFFFNDYAANTVGNGVNKTSVLLNGIMKEAENADRYATNNRNGYQTKIYAAAYIRLADGTIVVSDYKYLSVYDVLKLIESNDESYAAQETKLASFYEKWQNSMEGWAFDKIGK